MLSQHLVMLSVWGGFFAEAKLLENVLKNINVHNEIIFSVNINNGLVFIN